jgi:hypothetical protein
MRCTPGQQAPACRSQRELAQLAQSSNFATRKSKEGALDTAQVHAGWADKLARTQGVKVASVAPSVWHAATGNAAARDTEPADVVPQELALSRAAQQALALAQQEKAPGLARTWSSTWAGSCPAPAGTRPGPPGCWRRRPTGSCARSPVRSCTWKRPSPPRSRAPCCAPTGAASTAATAACATPRSAAPADRRQSTRRTARTTRVL